MKLVVKNIFINILIFIVVIYAVHLYQTRNSATGLAPEIKGYMLNGQAFEGLAGVEKPVGVFDLESTTGRGPVRVIWLSGPLPRCVLINTAQTRMSTRLN